MKTEVFKKISPATAKKRIKDGVAVYRKCAWMPDGICHKVFGLQDVAYWSSSKRSGDEWDFYEAV